MRYKAPDSLPGVTLLLRWRGFVHSMTVAVLSSKKRTHLIPTGVDQDCLAPSSAVAKGFVRLPVCKSRSQMITTWVVSLTDFATVRSIDQTIHACTESFTKEDLKTAARSQRGIRLSRCKCACTLSFSASAHHILANHFLVKAGLIQKARPRARYVYWQFAISLLRKA